MAKSAKAIRKIGISTGGGDCPGLNAMTRAAVYTAIKGVPITEAIGETKKGYGKR